MGFVRGSAPADFFIKGFMAVRLYRSKFRYSFFSIPIRDVNVSLCTLFD
jgi:hypothetical protein